MCGIVDANVANQLWESGGTPAGKAFRGAVDHGQVPLVVGGRHHDELMRSGESMRRWLAQLQLAGRLTKVDRERVSRRTTELTRTTEPSTTQCESNDEHIIALAQVSGARLLFTNDQALTRDFKEKRLIDAPRGKVYSTLRSSEVTSSHRDLLRRTDLCRR